MTLGTVIAGWDGSEHSRDAVRFAEVVARAAGAHMKVVYVYRYDTPHQSSAAEVRMHLHAAAMHKLGEAERSLPYGSRATIHAVGARSVVQGLHDFAESEQADLVILGATTKGALELHAIGSVAERLLRGAPCAVAVAPRGYAHEENPGLRVIGVAYDGSDEAAHAVELAAGLARATSATLKLIEIVERRPPPAVGMSAVYTLQDSDESYHDAVRRNLEKLAESLPPELRVQTILADGDAAPEIIERAGILSLLVMGSRGYGPVRRALLGSVSAPVLRAAPCPVLVVPRAGAHVAAATPRTTAV